MQFSIHLIWQLFTYTWIQRFKVPVDTANTDLWGGKESPPVGDHPIHHTGAAGSSRRSQVPTLRVTGHLHPDASPLQLCHSLMLVFWFPPKTDVNWHAKLILASKWDYSILHKKDLWKIFKNWDLFLQSNISFEFFFGSDQLSQINYALYAFTGTKIFISC